MKLWKNKIAIGTGTLALAIPIIVVIGFLYFVEDMCGNYIHSEYTSPNKKFKAVVFQRDCGATTGFSTQISIIDADENLENESGNIYVIDGHPNNVAPMVNWATNDELVIHKPLSGLNIRQSRVGVS